MSEIWLVVEIHPEDYMAQKSGMILNFAKPTVERLENDKLAETFHFLFEPYFLFRVRTSDIEKRQKVKSIIDENLAKTKEPITKIEFKEDYTGEQEQFGTEGWLHVQKLFEVASRISLLKQETIAKCKPASACQLERQFSDRKLVHCFLNAQGLSILDEANFHNGANIERLLRAYGFFHVVERLTALEAKFASGRANS